MKKTKIAFLLILTSCMTSCNLFDVINNAVSENNPYIINKNRTKETYLNNEFNETESNLLNSYFGFVVDYLANDSYDLLDYTNDVSIYYYDMEKNDYNNYEDTIHSNYSFYKEDTNIYGINSKIYKNEITNVDSSTSNNTYLELSYDENNKLILLNLYSSDLYDSKRFTKNNDGYVIKNTNKGLPNSSTDLLQLDLNKDYILANDVSNLGSQKESCKTTGSPKVLVIPVEFSDVRASDKGYTIDAIKNAFYKNEDTKATLDFYSVYDYFYESSFGKLSLDIEVLDTWFMPKYESSYYRNATFKINEHVLNNGEQIVLNEALEYLDSIGYDLSKYDEDSNRRIDSIVMINTLDTVSPETRDDSFDWAFRYYNYYLKNKTEYYTYDNVAANDYIWANYQFLYLDDSGKYSSTLPDNPYTFIHEFSHILGAEDYYNYYSSKKNDGPLKGYDIMDETPTDHNPFTKMTYGWIDNANLVLQTGKYKLNAIEDNNACYIVACDFDLSLGAYQEYYLICYYGRKNINEKYSMFLEPSVVIYHVDASLLKTTSTYLTLLNDNNSFTSGGSKNDLISLTGVYPLSKITMRLVNNIKLTTNNGERIPFTLNFEYGLNGLYMVVK